MKAFLLFCLGCIKYTRYRISLFLEFLYNLPEFLTNKARFFWLNGCNWRRNKIAFSDTVRINVQPAVYDWFRFYTDRSTEMAQEMRVFMSLSRQKKCLLDAGALYGIFSLVFAQNNPSGIAYSLEPSPEPFKIMEYNIKANPGLRITPYMLALGSFNGKLKMKYEWQHLVSLSGQEALKDYVEADVVTLDSFLAKQQVLPDMVKIDTEGSEYDILKGGGGFFKRSEPLIFLELHVPWLEKLRVSVSDVFELLDSWAFRFYSIKGKSIRDPLAFFGSRQNYRLICSKRAL